MQSTVFAPNSWPELYRRMLEDAELLEDLGFDSMWFAEHRLNYDGWCPQPFVAASAAAAATSRLRVGTAIHVLPQYDALALAESVAYLSRMSHGRVDIGIGLGYRTPELDALGLLRRDRGARLDEALDVLREAWSGRPSPVHGKHFSYDADALSLDPGPEPPRIWLGGYSVPEIRRAAVRGYGLVLPPRFTPTGVAEIRDTLTAFADEANVAPSPIGTVLNVWLAEDKRAAQSFTAAAERHFRETERWNWRGRQSTAAPKPEAGVKQRLDAMVAGTADEVVARLHEYSDAGAELVVAVLNRDFTPKPLRESAAQFARAILPRVQDTAR